VNTAVTYTGALDVREDAVYFLARLLMLRRGDLGTRRRRRAPGGYRQPVRRVSVCPWEIGAVAKAALVLLHFEHGRPLPARHAA
jgi:hypothetical protein